MKKTFILGVTLLILVLAAPVSANYNPPGVEVSVSINNSVSVSNILTQIAYLTQQQSQYQQQEQTVNVAGGTTNSWIADDGTTQKNIAGITPYSETYSRLLYPGEVLTFPVEPGQECFVLSGLPVAVYTIGSGHGDDSNKVQTLEASPSYDPIYHHMDFGGVVVLDRIDYWTMKAHIVASGNAAFCVIDNRAPMNGYTTIEVTVT